MAMISKDKSLLFIQAPTTACSAVEELLQATGEFQWLGEKHMNLIDLENLGLVSAETMQKTRKVRGVRNPFDLMVSAYFKNHGYSLRDRLGWVRKVPGLETELRAARKMDFCSWIRWLSESRHLDVIYYRTALRYHDERFDHVVRYEQLTGDLTNAFEGLACADTFPRNKGQIELPVVGVTSNRKREYAGYYDDETRRMVERVARDDIHRFGYAFAP